MTIDLLDTPLRVSWRFAPEAPLPPAVAMRIVEQLVAGGVFYVTLEGTPLAHAALDGMLARFAKQDVRVTLVCMGTPVEIAALHPDLAIHQLYLEVGADPDERTLEILVSRLAAVRQQGFDPGLLLVPRPANIARLPRLMDFCREHGVSRCKLPNVPLDSADRPRKVVDLLGPDDLERLRRVLPETAAAAPALEIHDLFLWELLGPERQASRSEYGGCQAANSLGHVDAQGNLWPCASWPEPLGSLLTESLETVWASPMRRRIRAEIDTPPSGCRGCRDYSGCFGGCRGLARTFNQDHGGRDPLCRGVRR